MNTIIYTRVSTDEQADKGFSLRHQKEMLDKFCDVKGFKTLKHFQDDYSAKNFERPEWKKLELYVKANRKNIDKILFTKWDRFSRNIEAALRVIRLFKDWGIEVNSIEQPLDLSNPDNKAMLALYLVMPEVENDKISQRTKDGIVRARKEGAYTSKAPYGYTNWRNEVDKSTMKPNEDADMVKELYNEVSKGLQPIEQIRLAYSKKGFPLSKQQFYYMLRNQLYIGKVLVPQYKKDDEYWVEGLHESIIDDAIFRRVQFVLDGKKNKARSPQKKHDLLPLRSHVECELCGSNLTGSVSKGNGGEYAYYHCRKGCTNRVPTQTAHELFSDVLSNLELNSNIRELYVEVVKDVVKRSATDKKRSELAITSEIHETERNILKLEDKLVGGGIGDDTFNRINTRYNEKINELKFELLELENNKDSITPYIDRAVEVVGDLSLLYSKGDYDMKQSILSSVFPEKLVLSINECRTTKVNSVIELLTRIDKVSDKIGNKKADISVGLSILAPPLGLEPRTL